MVNMLIMSMLIQKMMEAAQQKEDDSGNSGNNDIAGETLRSEGYRDGYRAGSDTQDGTLDLYGSALADNSSLNHSWMQLGSVESGLNAQFV